MINGVKCQVSLSKGRMTVLCKFLFVQLFCKFVVISV